MDVDAAFLEFGITYQILVQGDVRAYAVDENFIQRVLHANHGMTTIVAKARQNEENIRFSMGPTYSVARNAISACFSRSLSSEPKV